MHSYAQLHKNYYLHHKIRVGLEEGAAPPPQENKNVMNCFTRT